MILTLADEQYAAGIRLGTRVEEENLRKHRVPRHGCKNNVRVRIDSYAAEIAVAFYLDLEFIEEDWFNDKPDVGPNEVKCTLPRRRLWIPQGKEPARPYVLVWSLGQQQYDIRGWAWGHEILEHGRVLRSREHPDRTPATYLDHRYLRPPETILRI